MVFSAEIVNEEVANLKFVIELFILYVCFQSLNVFDVAYSSPWYRFAEMASYIKIIMARANIPCTLTAGGFVEINKPMMTAVCFFLEIITMQLINFRLMILAYKNDVFLLHCIENGGGYLKWTIVQ